MGAARFSLGRIVATPGALEVLEETGADGLALLRRHVAGDWGEVCPEDAAENERSVRYGLRILSVYGLDRTPSDSSERLGPRTRLYVITEADRSATTILLPEDY